jgi:hypothetical protein
MTIAEYQNNIIKQVLLIDDKSKLNEISVMLKKVAPKIKLLKNNQVVEEKDVMEFESFEEWDAYLQSVEYHDPEQFLPEWGMTSLELRKFIWDAEHSGSISYDEFIEDIKTWRLNEP